MNERHAKDNRHWCIMHERERERERDGGGGGESGVCFKDQYPRDVQPVRDHFGNGHFAAPFSLRNAL